MLTIPALAVLADTLLVRPVDLPAPWYSVATGVLSIVVTLLLLGIAVALLGMARALKGAEHRLGGRMQGLADELIPLARNLNQIATQLSDVTTEARNDLKRLSGTVGAVDDAVRDVIEAGEARLARVGVLLDVLQDEAQATVASATGAMRGVRTGAGSLVSNLFRGATPPSRDERPAPGRGRRRDHDALQESDIRDRLAALEAAFFESDDDEEDDVASVTPRAAAPSDATRSDATPSDDDWDDLDDDFDEDLDDDLEDDLDDDDDDDDDDDHAAEGAEADDDADEQDDVADDVDDEHEADNEPDDALHGNAASVPQPRRGGPQIRQRRRA
jgi:hypothetical protein